MKIEQLQLRQPQDLNVKKDIKEYEKAAKEFEAFFAYYLLKTMRESIPKSGLLNPGAGGDMYDSMMDEKVAESIASNGGLGLSQLLIKQMTKIQTEK